MFHELESLTGMTRLRTTPYHAMGNGKTERFNQTLLSMLRNLTEHDKLRWKDSVSKVTHAYNCTKHESTNYSPFFLLFGCHPHLPIDLHFETDNTDNVSRSKYVENWSQSMKEGHRIAQEHNSKSHQHNKYHYDKKVHFTNLDIGDRVLVRNLTPKGGPGKLRSYWENEVPIITAKKGDNPVYEIVPEGTKRKPRVLHRNLLLPCPYLPLDIPAQAPPPKSTKNTQQ